MAVRLVVVKWLCVLWILGRRSEHAHNIHVATQRDSPCHNLVLIDAYIVRDANAVCDKRDEGRVIISRLRDLWSMDRRSRTKGASGRSSQSATRGQIQFDRTHLEFYNTKFCGESNLSKLVPPLVLNSHENLGTISDFLFA